jgi:WD40 repeat protein
MPHAATGELVLTLKGHSGYIKDVSFRPHGKALASTGSDKSIKVWDTTNAKEIVSFKGHPEDINARAYSPYGKRLATASEDKTIRIWELEKILPRR